MQTFTHGCTHLSRGVAVRTLRSYGRDVVTGKTERKKWSFSLRFTGTGCNVVCGGGGRVVRLTARRVLRRPPPLRGRLLRRRLLRKAWR